MPRQALVRIRRGEYPGHVPDELLPGELGVNEFDQLLFHRDANGAVLSRPLGTISATDNILPNMDLALVALVGDTAAALTAGDIAPGWWYSGGSTAALAGQRVTDAPPGFKYSLKITVTTPDPAPTGVYYVDWWTGDIAVNSLKWGTAEAVDGYLNFSVKAHRTGFYSGSIDFYGSDWNTAARFLFGFSINVADTWEYKSIQIPAFTTPIAQPLLEIDVRMVLASASDFLSTAGWQVSSPLYRGVTGTTNGIAAVTDCIQFAGPSLTTYPVSAAASARLQPSTAESVATVTHSSFAYSLYSALTSQQLIVPRVNNTTFYVNATTGDDAIGDGLTPNTAWKTIHQACVAMQFVDANGFNVTIQVADGTYIGGYDATTAGGVAVMPIGWRPRNCKVFSIIGNETNPENCIIRSQSATWGWSYGIGAGLAPNDSYCNSVVVDKVSGFQIENATPTDWVGGVASWNSTITRLDNIKFGANLAFGVDAWSRADCRVYNITFLNNIPKCFQAEVLSRILLATGTINFPNAITVSAAVLQVMYLAQLNIGANSTWSNTGNVTSPYKYKAFDFGNLWTSSKTIPGTDVLHQRGASVDGVWYEA